MAETTLTPTQLVLNTASADIVDGDGTLAGTLADGWSVAASGKSMLLLKFLDDGSGATVTVKAGDRPPSHREGLGDLTITLAASDVKYVVVEQARFLRNDGTIHIVSSDAGTEASAFLMPRNW